MIFVGGVMMIIEMPLQMKLGVVVDFVVYDTWRRVRTESRELGGKG